MSTKIRDNIEELLILDIEDGDDDSLKLIDAVRSLSDEDKRTLCYYAELHSFRKMEAMLGASATTWRREIVRIRKLIQSRL